MTDYLLTGNKEKCYGCTACEQKCPKKAIKMHENSEGFLYPVLDKDLCIDCGLCKKVCPYQNISEFYKNEIAYALTYNNEKCKNSASGGAFIAVANYVLDCGGLVCGCIFDNAFKVEHVLSNNQFIVEKMQGSKYVQSNLKNVYTEILTQLNNGKQILFTGTPCQVDGLKLFLGKDYESLYTIDLICHGVPSPKLLEDYLNYIENKHGKIIDFKFRDKNRNGWGSSGTISIKNGNKNKIITTSQDEDAYYNLYYKFNAVSRDSCYSCKYSKNERVGDLTIGDYWGIDKVLPSFDTKKGVSVVIPNTKKGQSILKQIENDCTVKETKFIDATKSNGNLVKPTPKPEKRNNIYQTLNEFGFSYLVKKECQLRLFVPKLKRLIPRKMKLLLRKVLK